MATIQKRGEGSYQIRVFVGISSDGKQMFQRKTYKPALTDKAGRRRPESAIMNDVEKFAAEFEVSVKRGEVYSGENVRFDKFAREVWAVKWAPVNLTQGTCDDYENLLETRIYPYIGHIHIADVKPLHIQDIITDEVKEGKAAKTVKRTFTVVNSVFKYAYNMQVIGENPCSRVELPKTKKKVNANDLHFFTVEQTQRFLDALAYEYPVKYGGRKRKNQKNGKVIPVKGYEVRKPIQYQFQVLFTMAAYTAFRRGELVPLVWRDVDFENGTVSINKAVQKTKQGVRIKDAKSEASERVQTMPKVVMNMLRKWHTQQKVQAFEMGQLWQGKTGKEFDDNFIFIQENGLMMNIDSPYHKFKKLIKQYNEHFAKTEAEELPDIRLHDLRHTVATLLLSEGYDVETVSSILGHAHASVTLDVYGHWLEENKRKAVNAMEEILSKRRA